MRAVLSSLGSNGDAQPMLALAAELRRSGHDAVVALSPNFERRVKDMGIDFVRTGPVLPEDAIRSVITAQMQNRRPAAQVRQFLEASLPSLPGMYRSLLQTCQNADILIGSPYQLACRMVHESTSIPYVSLHLSQFAELGGRECQVVSAGLINPYRKQEGLPPLDDPLGTDGRSTELALYAVSRHLLKVPPQWPTHCKVVGFFFLEEQAWQPTVALREFCEAGEAPVVITFGSVVYDDPKPVTHLLRDAVELAGCRAIIQNGWGGVGNGIVSDGIYTCGYAPHSWLFPKAALVVHHGGAGTTASTFRSGVPSLIVPHTLDQPIWAEFARAKGCARSVIPFSHLNSARLAATIKGSLGSPQIYEAAAAFGDQIRQERGVEAARELLENLMDSRRGAFVPSTSNV